jgi:hypothetical protein
MAKDTLEYKGEVWGRIWESITWNKEEKEYGYLANYLFMAAKADIIAEKEANGGKYTKKMINISSGPVHKNTINNSKPVADCNDNLEKLLDSLSKDENHKIDKDGLRGALSTNYAILKDTLDDVRMLGVGNSNLEVVGKACKICLKAMGSAIIMAFNASLMVSQVMTPVMLAINLLSAGVFTKASTIAMGASETLSNIRSDAKTLFKESGFVQQEMARRADAKEVKQKTSSGK